MGSPDVSIGPRTSRIEDYALVGDTHSAALVRRDGAVEWMCLPRFDSPACFAALLGDAEHGRWTLAPVGPSRTARRYRGHSLVLETDHTTDEGVVQVVDCMPPRAGTPDFVRVVRGVRGRVDMEMRFAPRFDYGSLWPWLQLRDDGALAMAGADALSLYASVPLELVAEREIVARFTLTRGDEVAFVAAYHPSHEPRPPRIDAEREVSRTEEWWRRWISHSRYDGAYGDAVLRSLAVLKACTYSPTGGIVAAPTTSLPEQIGGVRNWDYRYCWIRDATFTLDALLETGYTAEALAWRDWLLRAVAGEPEEMQLMYGVAGERRIPEQTLPWLPGFERSAPVRIGNAASTQFQLDVYGEVMDALAEAREANVPSDEQAWRFQRRLLDRLEEHWREPDEGIWEVRGPRRHFTHSKVMAWVAFDRAVAACERFGLPGDAKRWRTLADQVHREVCEHGWSDGRNAFTQYFGSSTLDASVLVMPLVGFLPADDPRVRATVTAIERELVVDGFVLRYSPDARSHVDGLPGDEGAFLACTFWLADVYAVMGRVHDAEAVLERLLAIRNDVGLLAEEYDPEHRRQLGNFPQALSHLSLVNTACVLDRTRRGEPAEQRLVRHTARRHDT